MAHEMVRPTSVRETQCQKGHMSNIILLLNLKDSYISITSQNATSQDQDGSQWQDIPHEKKNGSIL